MCLKPLLSHTAAHHKHYHFSCLVHWSCAVIILKTPSQVSSEAFPVWVQKGLPHNRITWPRKGSSPPWPYFIQILAASVSLWRCQTVSYTYFCSLLQRGLTWHHLPSVLLLFNVLHAFPNHGVFIIIIWILSIQRTPSFEVLYRSGTIPYSFPRRKWRFLDLLYGGMKGPFTSPQENLGPDRLYLDVAAICTVGICLPI